MSELLLPPQTPSSPSPSPKTIKKVHDRRSFQYHAWSPREVVQNTGRKMIRTALVAVALRLLFGLLKSLLKSQLRWAKLAPLLLSELFSVNALKWGILAGSLSSYRGAQQLLERYLQLPAKLSSALAGAVSSLGFLVMNIETRTELALYTSVRAAHGLLTAHVQPNLPWKALREFDHWEIVSMCLASIQINYGLMFETTCHEPKYLHFLQRCTTLDRRVLVTAANLQRSLTCPEMLEYAKAHQLPVLPPEQLKQTCTFVHDGLTCQASVIRYFVRNFFNFSLPLYLPLKLSTALIFSPHRFMKAPFMALGKVIGSAARSALFLASLGGVPYAAICVFANSDTHSPIGIAAGSGSVAGLTLLIEPKGRRLDLALYTCMQAVRSFTLLLVRHGYLHRPTRHHVTLMNMLAFGAMFYQYDHECEQLHPNVVKGLNWIS